MSEQDVLQHFSLAAAQVALLLERCSMLSPRTTVAPCSNGRLANSSRRSALLPSGSAATAVIAASSSASASARLYPLPAMLMVGAEVAELAAAALERF